MRTIEKAHNILATTPKEALGDAIGLAAMVVMIFAGFLVPAFL